MGDLVKQILAAPIQLTDQVIAAAGEAAAFKQECWELKSKAEKLAGLLRQAARASSELYERPTRRIIDETVQVLDRTLGLVHKCGGHGFMKRIFTINQADALRKALSQLENAIGNVSWLIRISTSAGEIVGLPPVAANEPILCFIWEQIAILSTGSADERANAAASLVGFARDNPRYGKLIIEEGGVGPLLKLLKEGKPEGQESAAQAIGLLGKDQESVELIIFKGTCQVFANVLKEGPMKVQAVVAWAVSEFAAHYPNCQDLFAQNNVIRFLVGHLAFETVEEHSKYTVSGKATSIHAAVVMASGNTSKADDLDGDQSLVPHPLGNPRTSQMHNVVTTTMAMKHNDGSNGGKVNSVPNHRRLSVGSNKARETEDPATKEYMKAMAAKALWHLSKGNSAICRSITESRGLLCYAVLLEKGSEEIRYYSAMALMEITRIAEEDAELRRSAFKPNSHACKAVVDQLFRIIKQEYSNLLLPSIKAIGSLARTFKATETRMIGPLVNLLDEREDSITLEACIALTKFSSKDNYLHVDHSKAIIAAGGARHLVQLVYLGESVVKRHALVLLCHVAVSVPDSEELAGAEVLRVVEWACKQGSIVQNEDVESLIIEAKVKLELYQSRGSRGFH